MFLFARRRTLNPAKARAAAAFAVEVAGRAREVIGHDVYAWMTAFSPEAGVLQWSARFDSVADLETAMDKLAVANEFNDFVEQSDHLFVGPLSDTLATVVHGTPDSTPAEYIQVVQARCAPGKLAPAIDHGRELADAVTRITGRSCLFCAVATGPWGGIGWISGAPDAAAYQAANEAWYTSPEAGELMARGGELFQADATTTVLRRLA